MAAENVHELNSDNFQSDVVDSDIPVLVDFWAEWCMPCKILGPTVDELAGEFAGKMKVGKVDVESSRDVALKYGIGAIPTLIMFKGGEVVKKFVGLQTKNDLRAAINDVLAD